MKLQRIQIKPLFMAEVKVMCSRGKGAVGGAEKLLLMFDEIKHCQENSFYSLLHHSTEQESRYHFIMLLFWCFSVLVSSPFFAQTTPASSRGSSRATFAPQ